ncbi:MAG: hypothetical protein D9V44_09385 [Actinobacteria bacterium]|nr:MAG: hypothetical protein D9V44_09385 [Actinomycetota bacterium]
MATGAVIATATTIASSVAAAASLATSPVPSHTVATLASESVTASGAAGAGPWAGFVHATAGIWSGGLSTALTNLLISGWIVVLVVEWVVRNREAKRERDARNELLVEVVMNIRIMLEDVQDCPNWLADALVRDYLLLPELRELVLGSRALGLQVDTRMRLLSLMKAVDLVDGVYRAQRDLAIRMATGEQLVDGLWEQMEEAFRRSTVQALVLTRDCESRLTKNPSGPIQATIPLLECGSCGTEQQVDPSVIQGETPFQCLNCGAEGWYEGPAEDDHAESEESAVG